MESIECGAPVVLGRHFENFAAEAEAISATCGEARQETASGAASVLQTWLRDPAARTASLNSQRRALPDAEQIAKAYLEKLSPWLKKLCA